jgi:branched-subunit amino acid aminotransferase/4-amino-4-deoxychorismate lyase
MIKNLKILASIHDLPRSLALQCGNALFTTLKIQDDRALLQQDHFRKIQHDLKEVFDFDLAYSDFYQLIKPNLQVRPCRLRISFIPDQENLKETSFQTLFVMTEKKEIETLDRALKLKTLEIAPRLDSFKWPSYGMSLHHVRKCKAMGFDDMLGVFRNEVLETSTANIFFIKNGILYTPKENIYKGVTRNAILKELPEEVIECRVSAHQLKDFEACFVTNSICTAQSVSRINEIEYNSEMSLAYVQKIEEKLDEHQ